MNSFYSIMPIVGLLSIGYVLGRSLTDNWLKYFGKLISLLVVLLLLSIGLGFGNMLHESNVTYKILGVSIYFSLLTTAFSSALILIFYKFEKHKNDCKTQSSITIIGPLKEIFLLLSSFLMGVVISLYYSKLSNVIEGLEIGKWLLFLLILFVGVDLNTLQINRNSFSIKMFFIPLLVVLGSLLGGAIANLYINYPFNISMALSSGFGWFTLSSVLLSEKFGAELGTIALFIDLFRELLAIVLLYLFGRNIPKMTIGAAGATSLDSTLPVVKQACSANEIPLAVISGLILTILAPVLITFFISL